MKRKLRQVESAKYQYILPAASSVKRAITFLNDNEYIYPANEGYIVYERFMAIWLQRL